MIRWSYPLAVDHCTARGQEGSTGPLATLKSRAARCVCLASPPTNQTCAAEFEQLKTNNDRE